jgi:hypothetical protein
MNNSASSPKSLQAVRSIRSYARGALIWVCAGLVLWFLLYRPLKDPSLLILCVLILLLEYEALAMSVRYGLNGLSNWWNNLDVDKPQERPPLILNLFMFLTITNALKLIAVVVVLWLAYAGWGWEGFVLTLGFLSIPLLGLAFLALMGHRSSKKP